ncbi:surface-adhesin E family protein [Chromobacterium violaceum]|uniref:surface-adhesin E family protein n=1 Tax=Chromobacterium violaceum TaxID=536 RepID=UPI00385D1322
MKKALIACLLFASASTFAATWETTYYNVKQGYLFVDSESLNETAGTTKMWTLFAPSIPFDRLGEGYSYRKILHVINCKERTAAITKAVYYDLDNVAHDAKVDDSSAQVIVPDSENDFLWKYACKPEARKDLAIHTNNVSEFLAKQVQNTKQNIIQFQTQK